MKYTKEDIKQICQIYDNLRSERNTATIAYNSDDTFWEHILATYNLSQFSLPSNLDEEAKEIAYSVCRQLPNGEEKDNIVYYAILAAKAGAKWMLEQITNKINSL